VLLLDIVLSIVLLFAGPYNLLSRVQIKPQGPSLLGLKLVIRAPTEMKLRVVNFLVYLCLSLLKQEIFN